MARQLLGEHVEVLPLPPEQGARGIIEGLSIEKVRVAETGEEHANPEFNAPHRIWAATDGREPIRSWGNFGVRVATDIATTDGDVEEAAIAQSSVELCMVTEASMVASDHERERNANVARQLRQVL
jgi:hypothetical protein